MPDRGDLHALAPELANSLAAAPHRGALLVVDVSASERPHLHGIALVSRRGLATDAWRALSGAGRRSLDEKTVTGWEEHPLCQRSCPVRSPRDEVGGDTDAGGV
jgi:hypothetical protein